MENSLFGVCTSGYFVFPPPLYPVVCCRWSSPSSLGCQDAVPATSVLSLSLLPRSTGGWCSFSHSDHQKPAWHEGKKRIPVSFGGFLNLISDWQVTFRQKNSTGDFFVAYSTWWRASIYWFIVILKFFWEKTVLTVLATALFSI